MNMFHPSSAARWLDRVGGWRGHGGKKKTGWIVLTSHHPQPPPGLRLVLFFVHISSLTPRQIWFRMIVKKIKRSILGHDLYACYENPDRVKVHLRQSTLTAMCHGSANQKPYAHVEKYQCTNKKMTVELIVSWGVKWKIVCGTKCALPPHAMCGESAINKI